MERVWAWLVHAYTTAGVVLALLMVHFAYLGDCLLYTSDAADE